MSSTSVTIPRRPSASQIATRSTGLTPSITSSPSVTAPRPMKLATSMWSGEISHSPPCSRSTPQTRRTFDPIPSISAPSETRKRHRSWTCGSQAAFPITVSPRASTAAMTAFSVPVTEASSRKSGTPTSPSVRMRKFLFRCTSTPSRSSASMWTSSRRRPMTSPPGGGTIASPARASSGPAKRIEARIRRQSSSSSSVPGVLAACTSTSPPPRRSTVTPSATASASIVATSVIAGTFLRTTGSSVSRQAATIGSAAFLLPVARIVPSSGRRPSMTNDSDAVSATTGSVKTVSTGTRAAGGPRRAILPRPWRSRASVPGGH